MAHLFSLTDGTTVINLIQTSGYLATGMDMDTADPDQLDDPEITETFDVLVRGTSGPNIQSLVRAIETMLVTAKRRQTTHAGIRVYLQLQVDQDATTWRAEVLEGRLKPESDFLRTWFSNTAPAQLIVTHRAWEGPRTEIPLASATSGTPATGGKPITNAANDWVQIALGVIGGVLPTPLEIQLTNTAGTSVAYRNFYLANNAFSDPANFTPTVEGEARKAGYGTITADGSCSGGNYNARSFTNTDEIQWDLSATMMQDTQGREFQLLARFQGWSGTNVYVKPVLRDLNGLTILYQGDEQKLPAVSGTQIINLGSLPLPNGDYYTSYAATVLALQVRATGAASVNVDFMQLMGLDAHQHIVQPSGYSIPNTGIITFDNIEGIYHTGGITIFSPRAGLLRVFPSVLQRIHVLCDEGSSSNVARAMTVRAYVRERRLTV